MDPNDPRDSEEDSDLELIDSDSDSDSDIIIPPILAQPRDTRLIGNTMHPHFLYPATLPGVPDIVNYFRGLTNLHLYLGELQKIINPNIILKENSILTMPVLFLKLHLMPDQILPIFAYSSSIQNFFKYVFAAENNYRFGVACKLNTDGQNTYGTIAVAFEFSLKQECPCYNSIKAMGHQRFQLLSVNSFPECEDNNSMKLAVVKVLPNTDLPIHPYDKKHLNRRHREAESFQAIWPKWVYQQFGEKHLASLLIQKIQILFEKIELSSDPRILSFQAMRLGIFSLKQITHLMGIGSTVLRLKRQLNYWDENKPINKYMCATKSCRIIFCDTNNVFTMSTDGPHGIYCNIWGDIHSLITVTSLDSTLESTKIEFTSYACGWFLGYNGLKVLCPSCLRHFGWRFISITDSNYAFYGLNMKDIVTRL